MQLPQKTFIVKQCELYESDFDCNRQVKPLRVMQIMQDVATEHAKKLNVGWNTLHANSLLWVLSKVKINFCKKITDTTRGFTLYTWPLSPNRLYSERCFVAVDAQGEQLFSATTLWTLIDFNTRRIVSAERMNDFFHGEYDTARSDTDNNFQNVRFNDEFEFCYEKTIRRSDLDLNGHVNNTNYVTFAMDVLPQDAQISALEIVYRKELKFGDVVEVYCKREQNFVIVAGLRGGETCFTVVLQVAE